MVGPAARAWASFVGGGVAAALATVPLAIASQDAEAVLFAAVAFASAVGIVVAWRHLRLRAAFAGAALFAGFFALLAADLVAAAALLLLGAAACVVARAPAALRLVGAILFLWAGALVVATLGSGSAAFAAWSGLVLAAAGVAYLVAWAVRERRRWARHAAWAAAAAWVLLALTLATVDLLAFGDGLAIGSAAALAGTLVAVLVGWLRHGSSGPIRTAP